MKLAGYLTYGLIGVVGTGVAIGVPIAIKNSRLRNAQNNFSTVSLSVCEPNKKDGMSLISYGDNSSKQMCWDWADKQKELTNSYASEFTEIFQDSWGGGGKFWSGREGRWWTGQCIKEKEGNLNLEAQWTINIKSPKGVHESKDYVGLCDGTKLEETKFVKKEKDRDKENSWTLWACKANCFEDPKKLSEVKELTKERETNWKKVQFYSPKQLKLEKSK